MNSFILGIIIHTHDVSGRCNGHTLLNFLLMMHKIGEAVENSF